MCCQENAVQKFCCQKINYFWCQKLIINSAVKKKKNFIKNGRFLLGIHGHHVEKGEEAEKIVKEEAKSRGILLAPIFFSSSVVITPYLLLLREGENALQQTKKKNFKVK